MERLSQDHNTAQYLRPCLKIETSSQGVGRVLKTDSTATPFVMNSKYLIIPNTQVYLQSASSERNKTPQIINPLSIYQFKASTWGKQLKADSIKVSDFGGLSNVGGLIISNSKTDTKELALSSLQFAQSFQTDAQGTLYSWRSDQFQSVIPCKLRKSSQEIPQKLKLHCFHPENLFFACSDLDSASMHRNIYVVQSFDFEIYSEIKFTGEIINLCFIPHSMELAVLDDLNQITIYNIESGKITGMTRFPIRDPIQSMWANDMELGVYTMGNKLVVIDATKPSLDVIKQLDMTEQLPSTITHRLNKIVTYFMCFEMQKVSILSTVQPDPSTLYLSTTSHLLCLTKTHQLDSLVILESVGNHSAFMTHADILYLAQIHSQSGDPSVKLYQIQEINQQRLQTPQIGMISESQVSDGEGEGEDIIGEFAKQYEEQKIAQVEEEYRAVDPIQEEEEYGEDESEVQPAVEQSFRDTGLYKDIQKQRQQFQARQGGAIEEEELSVFTPFQPHPKSVFTLVNSKLEQDSIYDHSDNYNKTRFTTNLPQKFTKTNLPVTFHKKIKSSGYGSVPNSLKFSTKQKQKTLQQTSGPQYVVSKSWYDQPLPMTIPDELSILKEQALHKNAVVKLCYSPLGTKLASISDKDAILLKLA